MPGYATRLLTLRFGGPEYRIRALSDLQQFADPHGRAERAGISSAMWSLFGQVWPAGRVLAQAMSRFDVAGKRVLVAAHGNSIRSLIMAIEGLTLHGLRRSVASLTEWLKTVTGFQP